MNQTVVYVLDLTWEQLLCEQNSLKMQHTPSKIACCCLNPL